MPRIAPWLPLLGSTLALLFVLGGAKAGLDHMTTPQTKTDADQEFVHCSTALVLLQQNRTKEALDLLKSHANSPMPLPIESELSTEVTPSTQLLLLSKGLIQAAEAAKAKGQSKEAHAYLEQCHTLARRIGSTPQPQGSNPAAITKAMDSAVQHAEVALNQATMTKRVIHSVFSGITPVCNAGNTVALSRVPSRAAGPMVRR